MLASDAILEFFFLSQICIEYGELGPLQVKNVHLHNSASPEKAH